MSTLSIQTVLGFDPGTRRVGYGVLDCAGKKMALRDTGLIAVSDTTDYDALREIKKGADTLIRKYRPRVIGIERLYFSKNQKTAIAVAEARGVLILAASEASIPIIEVGPNEVKLAVAGYGNADKRAVMKMVKILLGAPTLRVIDDAFDALAIAITALRRS